MGGGGGGACVRACVRVCACVRARVRVRVRVRVCVFKLKFNNSTIFNKQPHVIIEYKKTTTYTTGNLGPGLGRGTTQ